MEVTVKIKIKNTTIELTQQEVEELKDILCRITKPYTTDTPSPWTVTYIGSEFTTQTHELT